MKKKAKLTLVGAGPGDPDLISYKGIKALQRADVILYDALVCEEILQHARSAQNIQFVGKRQGKHSLKQEQINQLIVSQAHQFGEVVRLKGGDPFIFGRGFEELEYAREHGLETEFIPGITSATSLPGLLNIPLTHRDCNRAFHILTATASKGRISDEVKKSVHYPGMKVILMGFRKLGLIAAEYLEAGKADEPIAVIQNGSLHHQQVVVSTMKDIVAKVTERQMGTPAIIVIGENIERSQNVQHHGQKLFISHFSQGPRSAVFNSGRRSRV